MLQNTRVKAFRVSELLREKQHGGDGGCKITPLPPPLQITINELPVDGRHNFG